MVTVPKACRMPLAEEVVTASPCSTPLAVLGASDQRL
jgi:hypothetical protein